MAKILVATDGSEHALKAAAYADRLVSRIKGEVELTVLYVGHIPTEVIAAQVEAFAHVDIEAMIKETGKTVLAKTLAVISASGKTVKTQIRSGDPASEICNLAKEDNCDLVIVGSRGLGRLSGIFLGSVSDRVARMSHCPVLIVK